MTKEQQTEIFYRTLSALANKYGVLDILESIDLVHLNTKLTLVDPMVLISSDLSISGRDFVAMDGKLMSTKYNRSDYPEVSLRYLEFPRPFQLTVKDGAGYEDSQKPPVTDQLQVFARYALDKSKKEGEAALQDLYLFVTDQFNKVNARHNERVLGEVARYLDIDEKDAQLIELFHQAAFVQPSWSNGGLPSSARIHNQWLDTVLEKKEVTLSALDVVARFANGCANFYGYIEMRNAYRIYRMMESENPVSKTNFERIIHEIPSKYVFRFFRAGILSTKLYDAQYLREKQKGLSRQEQMQLEKTVTDKEKNYLFRKYIALEKQRRTHDRGYFVPTKEELFSYAESTYLPQTPSLLAFMDYLHVKKRDFMYTRSLNTILNQYFYLDVNHPHVHEELAKALGFNGKSKTYKEGAFRLFMATAKELPSWYLKGHSQVSYAEQTRS